jgi:predicted small lipoprotein YifL
MSRRLSSLIALAALAASTLTSCGTDPPTAPRSDPNAGKHEITVEVNHFKIIGDCEPAEGNPGEFSYAVRILTLGSVDTLAYTLGNLTGGAGATNQPASHTLRFIMDPKAGAGFEFEPRCTEYDNGVADARMNEYGTTREHRYSSGTNWNNGLKIIRLGDGECGYEVEYSVSVRAL